MFKDTRNFDSLAPHHGLYCMWIRPHLGERAPLVSIWIDPEMRAFEAQVAREPCSSPVSPVVGSEVEGWAGEGDELQGNDEPQTAPLC